MCVCVISGFGGYVGPCECNGARAVLLFGDAFRADYIRIEMKLERKLEWGDRNRSVVPHVLCCCLFTERRTHFVQIVLSTGYLVSLVEV